MPKSRILPQILAALAASLILICSGFHNEWLTISAMNIVHEHPEMWIIPSPFILTDAFLPIGGIFGALLGLIVVDILGRRITLLFTTIPLIISCGLIMVGKSYCYFHLARFIAGLGVGIAFMVTPMYIGEIAETRIRGGLCVLMSIMLIVGRLVVLIIGPWISVAALGIVGAVIPIVSFTALLWVPESPYYFAVKKTPNLTRKSLARLRGTPDVDQEVQQIHNSVALNQRKAVNFRNLFTVQSNRKALAIIIGLLTFQQLSSSVFSVFAFVDYLDPPNQRSNYDIINIFISSIQLVTTICIVFLTDKVRRRLLLLISESLCVIFLLALVLVTHVEALRILVSDESLISQVATIGYTISYACGLGTLPIVMAAEIFPHEVKALALAISTVFYYIAGFGISWLWRHPIRDIVTVDIRVYLFIICNIMSAIFTYFVVPETKGRSLSEIQIAFQRHFKTLY